ncbi:MAG: flavodoxin [Bacteroidetes bacterium]|nr:MAG: flavodoxin [Bacteroidota bacterium]
MKKVGIFFGSSMGQTKRAAKKLQTIIGKDNADLHDIKETLPETILKYDNLVFGTSAWGVGDMQDDWEAFIDTLVELDFTGKKVALFGLGDQKEYPGSFVDGLGTLYCRFPDKSSIIGEWPLDGYTYYFSSAEKDGQFVGLALDEVCQPRKTAGRIKKWAEIIIKGFN